MTYFSKIFTFLCGPVLCCGAQYLATCCIFSYWIIIIFPIVSNCLLLEEFWLGDRELLGILQLLCSENFYFNLLITFYFLAVYYASIIPSFLFIQQIVLQIILSFEQAIVDNRSLQNTTLMWNPWYYSYGSSVQFKLSLSNILLLKLLLTRIWSTVT